MGALGLVVMPVGLVIKSDDYFLRMTRQLDSVEVSVNPLMLSSVWKPNFHFEMKIRVLSPYFCMPGT